MNFEIITDKDGTRWLVACEADDSIAKVERIEPRLFLATQEKP